MVLLFIIEISLCYFIFSVLLNPTELINYLKQIIDLIKELFTPIPKKKLIVKKKITESKEPTTTNQTRSLMSQKQLNQLMLDRIENLQDALMEKDVQMRKLERKITSLESRKKGPNPDIDSTAELWRCFPKIRRLDWNR